MGLVLISVFSQRREKLNSLSLLMFPSAATRPPGILHHPRPVFNPTPKLGFHASRNGLCDSPTVVRKHGGSIGVRCESAGQHRDDGYYMRRCVDLARTAVGHTSPNPMVGCVIVKDGNVVGEGFHPKAGQPHAEVFALRDAGDLAENATAYVSLEPCNHFGRTPPCTEALIKAKVKKVVVGMVDPNPIVASKGVDRLRDAGINVTVGVEGELCKKLNEAYIHQMLTGKPLVALRYSLSVNGCLLDRLGEGVMEAGGYFSKLLKEYDAIIISPTSFGDSFSLPLSQEPGANQPLQVIVARNPSSPIQIPALTNEAISKVIILTDNQAAVGPNIAQRGVETVILDRMDLGMVLDYCKRRGLCSVLLDLRGNSGDFIELLKEGMDQNLIQKFIMEILPLWDDDKESNGRRHVKDIVFSTKLSSHSILLEGYL